jgi:hypothetical protein
MIVIVVVIVMMMVVVVMMGMAQGVETFIEERRADQDDRDAGGDSEPRDQFFRG